MLSELVVRGYGSFGDIGCVVTRGYSCATHSIECFTAVTTGSPRNNRVTVSNGTATAHHRSVGENKFMSSDATAAELGEKFNDPRYYARPLS
jgi:hypothetical protein